MLRLAGAAEPGFGGLESLEQRQLFIADPLTIAHPTWFANYGTVVVDGVIDPVEWAGSVPITQAQANRTDSAVTIRMKYTELGLYLAADVKDQYLWADGGGAGSGTQWNWFDDDSLALFFDASNTRKRYMTPAGRALGFNIGAQNGALTGSGAVSRENYIAGNNPTGREGDLNGVQVNAYGAVPTGTSWKTVLHGTLNNNSDLDQGWTTEIFLPWNALGMGGMPIDGQAITMNYSVFFDDTGGTHDHSAHDADPNAAMRFGPRTLDDQINGVESSFNVSSPGMEGPINYAWVVFGDSRTSDHPSQVFGLNAANVDGYGARLNFTAPFSSSAVMALGGAKRGGVAGYEIRWSSYPIADELDWQSATEIHNTFVPHPKGMAESLRINGLQPGAEYYVAVRAVDGVGREGPMQSAHFFTQTESQDTTNGERLLTSPGGGSLVTESGDPFVMVGSISAPSNLYVRNLYNGSVWDSAHQQMLNFGQNPGSEGGAAGYFDALAANGVNTLRVTLESLALETNGQNQLPNGMYWLEYPAGHFNPAMQNYLLGMMHEAARTGIRLLLAPFDTFNYKAHFNLTAYAAANGGPLTTIDDFFQNAQMGAMVINRMETIINWVHSSPDATSVLGIGLPNEWDNWDWTLNAQGNGDPSRTLEMRNRSKFVTRVAQAVHAYDPNILIMSSTDGLVPRGPEARALFLTDGIDILAPHWYTTTTAEPINSPDADKSIRPVTDYAALAGYWQSNKRDNRVINNGEWGLVKWLWPTGKAYYTGVSPNPDPTHPWTVQNDVDLYRTTSWTQIAMGLGGNGMRLAGQEMRDLVPSNLGPTTTGYLPLPLPTGMREIQNVITNFAADGTIGFDYANYDAMTLAGRIGFLGTNKKLIGVGSSDGHQGMVYVEQNLNRTTGSVAGSSVTISGLTNGQMMDVEFWSTDNGGTQLDVQWGMQVVGGKLTIALPTFAKDVMVRFKEETT